MLEKFAGQKFGSLNDNAIKILWNADVRKSQLTGRVSISECIENVNSSETLEFTSVYILSAHLNKESNLIGSLTSCQIYQNDAEYLTQEQVSIYSSKGFHFDPPYKIDIIGTMDEDTISASYSSIFNTGNVVKNTVRLQELMQQSTSIISTNKMGWDDFKAEVFANNQGKIYRGQSENHHLTRGCR